MGRFIVIYIFESLLYLVKEYHSSKCSCSRHIITIKVFDDFKKYKFSLDVYSE